MAILPVSSINISNKKRFNNTSFMSRSQEDNRPESHSSAKRNLAKVPVIVLMAMTPGLTPAEGPAKAIPIDSEQLTELLAYAAPVNEESAVEFTQAAQQTTGVYGVAGLERKHIRTSKIIECNNGQKYNLVYHSLRQDPKTVERIYVFKCDGKGNIDKTKYPDANLRSWHPPFISALIYHDLADDEFLGIRVIESAKSKKTGTYHATRTYEIKIDKESAAQPLLDFYADESGWINKSHIEFIETYSPKLETPKYTDLAK